MRNVIELDGCAAHLRKILRESRVPFGKTFEFRLMTGIALPISYLFDVKVRAMVFGMAHRAGRVF